MEHIKNISLIVIYMVFFSFKISLMLHLTGIWWWHDKFLLNDEFLLNLDVMGKREAVCKE